MGGGGGGGRRWTCTSKGLIPFVYQVFLNAYKGNDNTNISWNCWWQSYAVNLSCNRYCKTFINQCNGVQLSCATDMSQFTCTTHDTFVILCSCTLHGCKSTIWGNVKKSSIFITVVTRRSFTKLQPAILKSDNTFLPWSTNLYILWN